MKRQITLGSIIIKNATIADYSIEELHGYILGPGIEVELINVEDRCFYGDWESANKLVTNLPTAKLYQDIQAGIIYVVKNEKPSNR